MSHQHEYFGPEEQRRFAEPRHDGMSLHEEYLHEITGRILGNSGNEQQHSHHHHHLHDGSLNIPPIDSVIGGQGQHEHHHHHHGGHNHHHGRHIGGGGGGGGSEMPPTAVAPPSDQQPYMPPSDLPPWNSSETPPWQQQPYPVIPPFDGGSGNAQPAQPGDNTAVPPAPAVPGDNGVAPPPNPGDTQPPPQNGGTDNTNPPANPGDSQNQPASTKPADHGDPNSFFICQFADKRFNPNGPPSSEDCGPTSLAMIAKAYGVTFTDPVDHKQVDAAGDPEALVMGVRGLMTGKHGHNTGTDVTQVENAAHKMGFQTGAVTGMNDLDQQLAQGHMVVLSGNPKDYEKDLGLHYGIGGKIYDGGHFITVVGKDGDKYIVNDPATHGGSMELTREQVDKYIKNEGASGEIGVAVFK